MKIALLSLLLTISAQAQDPNQAPPAPANNQAQIPVIIPIPVNPQDQNNGNQNGNDNNQNQNGNNNNANDPQCNGLTHDAQNVCCTVGQVAKNGVCVLDNNANPNGKVNPAASVAPIVPVPVPNQPAAPIGGNCAPELHHDANGVCCKVGEINTNGACVPDPALLPVNPANPVVPIVVVATPITTPVISGNN